MTQQIFEDIHGILQAIPIGDENAVWKCFYSIKTDLEFDKQTTQREKTTIDFLNSNLADAIQQKSLGLIGRKLASLKSSLESRTTGLDGWSLRA